MFYSASENKNLIYYFPYIPEERMRHAEIVFLGMCVHQIKKSDVVSYRWQRNEYGPSW
jgi:hypothetical protein